MELLEKGFMLRVPMNVCAHFDPQAWHGLMGYANLSYSEYFTLTPISIPIARFLEMRKKKLFSVHQVPPGARI